MYLAAGFYGQRTVISWPMLGIAILRYAEPGTPMADRGNIRFTALERMVGDSYAACRRSSQTLWRQAMEEWRVIRSELPASMTVSDEKSSGCFCATPLPRGLAFRAASEPTGIGQRIAAPLIGKGAMHELLHILLSRSERPHKHFRAAQPGSAQAAKRPGYR